MSKQQDQNNSELIKGRALEIYQDLAAKVDLLQPGETLPSIRALQRQYYASQKTICAALHHLEASCSLIRQPRRKARLSIESDTSGSGVRRLFTVLGLSSSVAANWQPVIDLFNERHRRQIKPHYVDTLEELVALCQYGQVDFAMFHCNPITQGTLSNSLSFINLQELAKTLHADDYYPGLLISDPEQRFWGIVATLSTSAFFVNRSFAHIACQDYTWEELLPQLRKLQQTHRDLLYPFVFNGYYTFLMHNGARMLDPGNPSRLCFNNPQFINALKILQKILKEQLAPLFSETYFHQSSLRWFENRQIGAMEIFLTAVKRMKVISPEYDLFPMPAQRGVRREVYSEFFSICASSLNYATAWDFIKLTLSKQVQQLLTRHMMNMPIRRHLRPEHFTQEQFQVFAGVLENGCNPPENYYLPIQLRLLIETGVDRWMKYGGDMEEFLCDLEKSCQQRLENLKVNGK